MTRLSWAEGICTHRHRRCRQTGLCIGCSWSNLIVSRASDTSRRRTTSGLGYIAAQAICRESLQTVGNGLWLLGERGIGQSTKSCPPGKSTGIRRAAGTAVRNSPHRSARQAPCRPGGGWVCCKRGSIKDRLWDWKLDEL